jgi:hypothetical protein
MALKGVMTVTKKFTLWFGGVVTFLSIFWVVDLPQTVRLKAAIVRMLPFDPESMDSTIRNLCAGSHSGDAGFQCYLTFRSEEAAKAIADDQARKRKCQQLAQRMESGEEKDWIHAQPRSIEDLEESLKQMGGLEGDHLDAKLARDLMEDSYLYVGNDPAIRKKGIISFYPDKCEFHSFTEIYRVKP